METVLELVQDSVRRFDRRPFLLIRPGFRTRTTRYRDLGRLLPRVARVLRDRGLQPGDRAIIWAVNRPEWGITFLGAVHAGIVLVPLDVRSAPDFAAKVAAKMRASLVLASAQTAAQAADLGLPVLLIERVPDLARRAEPLPAAAIGPDDLVEVVFTSGTTGEPKGAMLTHRNIASNAQALLKVFPLGPKERMLSVLPLSHMFEQSPGFLAPMHAGASIVYPVSRQPSVLLRTFRDFKVSILLIVPQGLKLLDNAIERKVDQGGKRATFEKLHRWAPHVPRFVKRLLFRPVLRSFGGRLHTIGIGGAAMDPDLGRRWADMGLDVLQGYGATELGPLVSFTRKERNRIGSVGEVIPGVEMRIAADGEVLVRGPNVFAGYWEDPEKTAEAIDAQGWYHTGDIGEISPEGFLTLRGRKKDMLAMPDGTKVYPEDIEAVLAKDERIQDATVVGFPIGPNLKIHAVFLIEDREQPDLVDAVVRDANAKLGAHQQIRSHSLWSADDFPRTHTLKVKKREVIARLEADATAAAGVADAAVTAPGAGADQPPAGAPTPAAGTLGTLIPLVASIAEVPPEAVLPTARLSSDLNMDSLQRVELLGVIEEELGVFVDDSALDPEATVGQIAALVDASRELPHDSGILGWPLNPLPRALGMAVQELITAPVLNLFYRIGIRGQENLVGLEGPVIFASNHCLHTDNQIVMSSLPFAWRWRLSVAASAERVWSNPALALAGGMLANAFPIAREGGVRRSLELLGARLDRRFSILIYPEGKLTVGGPMQPFLAGTGLVAVESATAVVPTKLRINRMSWLDAFWPGTRNGNHNGASLRGEVEIVFGDPIWFGSDTTPAEATTRLEEVLAAL
jgi:long-chain acyl-CoA synthetase